MKSFVAVIALATAALAAPQQSWGAWSSSSVCPTYTSYETKYQTATVTAYQTATVTAYDTKYDTTTVYDTKYDTTTQYEYDTKYITSEMTKVVPTTVYQTAYATVTSYSTAPCSSSSKGWQNWSSKA